MRIPEKKDNVDSTTWKKKKKNKQKAKKSDNLSQDTPIPEELRLPPPLHDDDDENNQHPIIAHHQIPQDQEHLAPQNADANDTAIPPDLRLPPPICDDDPPLPPPQQPPPIPPIPRKYEKTSTKDLKKKDKELTKKIISVQRQLQKLLNDKAHIECCLDCFETDQDDFMNTLETNSTPPSEPDKRAPSPPPPPVPPQNLFHYGNIWVRLSLQLYQQIMSGHAVTVAVMEHTMLGLHQEIGVRAVEIVTLYLNPSPCSVAGRILHLLTDAVLLHFHHHHLYHHDHPSPCNQHRPQVCPCWECMHEANFI